MSNRYFDELPDYVHCTDTWHNKSGKGTYWKRSLHKARRRYWKEMIKREFWRGLDVNRSRWMYSSKSFEHYPPARARWPHPRDPDYYESMVNWKCW